MPVPGRTISGLAQEQEVGAAAAPGALLPGELAVWDGHVAMIVGNGMMVEAQYRQGFQNGPGLLGTSVLADPARKRQSRRSYGVRA